MLEIRRRVGSKGQVVIPKTLRDVLGIGPGTEVMISVEERRLVVRPVRRDAVEVFRGIAESGKSVRRFPPHAAYERELVRRRR